MPPAIILNAKIDQMAMMTSTSSLEQIRRSTVSMTWVLITQSKNMIKIGAILHPKLNLIVISAFVRPLIRVNSVTNAKMVSLRRRLKLDMAW